jgi:hypothetical protein
MRVPITIMTSVSLLAIAVPVQADEHFTEVSELLLDDDGDGSIQYVELIDPEAEEFPEEYQLSIYDEVGDLVGTVPIDPPPGTTRYLVATAAAEEMFDVTADAPLTQALPSEGQVCFDALEDGETETVACLDWGCAEGLVTPMFANGHGRAPDSGMSLQLQDSGAYHVSHPTPDAPNVSGDASQASCTGDDDDGDQDDDDGGGGGCAAAGSRAGGGGLLLAGIGIALATRRRRRA